MDPGRPETLTVDVEGLAVDLDHGITRDLHSALGEALAVMES